MTVTLVAAVARNGVIGSGDTIPWTLAGEQRQFKELTTGHVLVMGRRTFESIGRPLPDRTTVVVTRQGDWTPRGGLPGGVLLADSVPAALDLAAGRDDEVYVVGGAQIYAEALPVADAMVLSWVDLDPTGDTYFPAVEWAEWIEVERSEHDGWSRVRYRRAQQS